MSGEWSDMYGEVVWAKCPSFDWWPCYVYDPDKIPDSSEEVREKAAKLKGKQYAVYFYGDTSYSFTTPKNIVLYNEESKSKYWHTKHAKRYMEQFEAGKKIADIEVNLEKNGRVNFHLQGSASDGSTGKKKERSKHAEAGSELYFSEDQRDESVETRKASKSNTKEQKKRKLKSPFVEKRKRGRPRTNPHARLDSEQAEDEDEDEEEANGELEQEEDNDEEEDEQSEDSEEYEEEEDNIIIKPASRKNLGRSSMPLSTPVNSSANEELYREESLVDRLTRFGKILVHCTANNATQTNLPRIMKILDKLAAVEVRMADLVKSGIGKTITELRRNADETVSSRAQTLRAKWKAIVQNEEGSTLGPVRSSVSVVHQSSVDSCSQPENTHNHPGSIKENVEPVSALTVLPASSAVNPEHNHIRARAVRLLREAATSAPTSDSILNNGELAFAVEKAAMEAFHVGQPRYFEFITRFAKRLKSESDVLPSLDMLNSVLSSFDFTSEDFSISL